MNADTDLFGEPVKPEVQWSKLTGKPKRKTQPKGYAARPGSGPAGETCKSCEHYSGVRHAKTYRKCGLMRRVWTSGMGTDIKASSPACRFWEKPKP